MSDGNEKTPENKPAQEQNPQPAKKQRGEHLRQYCWKPGQSGNPHGLKKGTTHWRTDLELALKAFAKELKANGKKLPANSPEMLALRSYMIALAAGREWAVRDFVDREYGPIIKALQLEHSGQIENVSRETLDKAIEEAYLARKRRG